MIDAHRVTLAAPDDFDGWRDAARDLAEAGVPASAVVWQVEGEPADLFGSDAEQASRAKLPGPARLRRSRPDASICHSDPERFALLYAMLLRLKTNRHALDDQADPLVRRLQDLAKAVRRDIHKMHAFVRFREIDDRFVAFFEPEHHIVRRSVELLRQSLHQHALVDPDARAVDPLGRGDAERRPGRDARRCAVRRSARGDVAHLLRQHLQPRAAEGRRDAQGDAEEILAQHAGDLARSAPDRRCSAQGAGDDRPVRREGRAAARARGRAPHRARRQPARLMGGAAQGRAQVHALRPLQVAARRRCSAKGRSTPRSCSSASSRATRRTLPAGRSSGPPGSCSTPHWRRPASTARAIYVTNAVKHFKFVQRGKKRIHSKPGAGEIEACRWWIEHERELIRPPVTVALGATAAHSLFGKADGDRQEPRRSAPARRRQRMLDHRPPELPPPHPRRRPPPRRTRPVRPRPEADQGSARRSSLR